MTVDRFCYLLLAHTDPDGMLRTVRRIRTLSPGCEIVVRHHDPDYVEPARIRDAGATPLLSPVHVRWGDWTQVEMVLGACAFARAAVNADHFVVISGQDYPIRDLREWEQEVRDSEIDALLDPLPTQTHNYDIRWSVRTMPRTGSDMLDRGLRFALNRAGAALDPLAYAHSSGRPDDDRVWLGLTRRFTPGPPMTVTKCAQWATLRDRALDGVLRRDREDCPTRRFFEHVKIPDESYLSSLLHDTPGLRIAHGQTSAKEFREGQGSPEWIDEAVLQRLRRSSAAPFARKFAPDVDAEVIAAADALCERSPAQVWADVVESGRPTDARRWRERVRATVFG